MIKFLKWHAKLILKSPGCVDVRYRTRYFSDSGIIGKKEFVAKNYKHFKLIFQSKNEKRPKPIKGLDGVYSLKRLAETIT